MFEKDYEIVGLHATKAKYLAKPRATENDKDIDVERPYYFDRVIDVFMNAIVFALHYYEPATDKEKSRKTSSKDNVKILAAAFNKERSKCEFLYRLVMLLENSTNVTQERRIERAFKDPVIDNNVNVMNENMKLFDEYLYAGIDILYDKLTVGGNTQFDYTRKIYELMEDFHEDNLVNRNSVHEELDEMISEITE